MDAPRRADPHRPPRADGADADLGGELHQLLSPRARARRHGAGAQRPPARDRGRRRPGFDFTNGFHDTANVVASAISTRALSPRTAIALASLLNFAGAFISLKVAATIATGIIDPAQVTETIAFAGLLGAITWNLITWSYGLPSSSSHALIGGVIGAMLAAVGGAGVKATRRDHQGRPAGDHRAGRGLLVAGLAIVVIYLALGRRRPGTGQPRLPPRPGRLELAAVRSPTGPTTRRRRWA